MVDVARIRSLGREGCFTSGGFVRSTLTTSGVVIKPLSDIAANQERINALSLGLNQKAASIETIASQSKKSFQTYLGTAVPVCGEGITGWLGKAAGTSSFQKCLEKRMKLQGPISDGNIKFVQMSDKMRELHADYSELLQFSPNILDWQKLCQSKLDLDARHRELRSANTKLVEQALKKLQKEETAQTKANNEFNQFEEFLKLFLSALKALIAMVKQVFESFLRGLTKFSIFLAEHPTLIWVGGGIVVAGVLAVALRPYITIATSVLGIGKKKRKRR